MNKNLSEVGFGECLDAIVDILQTALHTPQPELIQKDLKQFDVPTLIMHGEDDQIVPINNTGRKSAKLIKGAKEIYYPGLPHGLTATNSDQLNADLLEFLKSV